MTEPDLPHDFTALSEKLPVFYPADALRDMEARLDAYVAGDGYLLPSGVEVDEAAAYTDAAGAFAHAIALTLATVTRTEQGYHVVDIEALDRTLPEPAADPVVAVALAEVRLLIQATYANAGDNDLARGIAGAEHFLLDLEGLYRQA